MLLGLDSKLAIEKVVHLLEESLEQNLRLSVFLEEL